MLFTVPQLICHSIKRPGKIADLVLCVCTYAVIHRANRGRWASQDMTLVASALASLAACITTPQVAARSAPITSAKPITDHLSVLPAASSFS